DPDVDSLALDAGDQLGFLHRLPYGLRRPFDVGDDIAPHPPGARLPHAQHLDRRPARIALHLRDHGAGLGRAYVDPRNELSWHLSLMSSLSALPRPGRGTARRSASHGRAPGAPGDRKSTRLNSSHVTISYAAL